MNVYMNEQFTIISFVAELILMHEQGKKITLHDAIYLETDELLVTIKNLGFNNYEFIDNEAYKRHYLILKQKISQLVLTESDTLAMNIRQDSGLIYLAIKLLNTVN